MHNKDELMREKDSALQESPDYAGGNGVKGWIIALKRNQS